MIDPSMCKCMQCSVTVERETTRGSRPRRGGSGTWMPERMERQAPAVVCSGAFHARSWTLLAIWELRWLMLSRPGGGVGTGRGLASRVAI
ncbi:hypothetical protein VFPBJ_08607 [Purpureocillium lilacinum]|uniref:Uncharacterized protein n=1 Tax=Purpureocillium lilacinum TaxID=33203 RepID=A0A179GEH6_PURLI|nr:hypothetical protein VFPBJ_08607 [Purpureocillium lilacinum]